MGERRAAVLLVVSACTGAASKPTTVAPGQRYDPEPTIVAGSFDATRAPDGNSVILDAPEGLIVVDTGRHRDHQDKLLARARASGKGIVAIINSHWHLDHTGGNAELRAIYPAAEIIATRAIEGALVDFFPRGRKRSDELIASGKATAQQIEDIELGREAVADTKNLLPTRAIERSGPLVIGGRTLDVRVAPFAATEADIWIYDADTKTVVAGDLVVAPVPFFDSACARGWREALGEIAATPFVRLIPGHGEPMTRETFTRWRAAFDALVDCAASTVEATACAAAWRTAAADLIAPGDEARIEEYATYYVQDVLRSAEATERFCRPLPR